MDNKEHTMTDLQKTQAAYAHFTLDEWKVISSALYDAFAATPTAAQDAKITAILKKLPSAAL